MKCCYGICWLYYVQDNVFKVFLELFFNRIISDYISSFNYSECGIYIENLFSVHFILSQIALSVVVSLTFLPLYNIVFAMNFIEIWRYQFQIFRFHPVIIEPKNLFTCREEHQLFFHAWKNIQSKLNIFPRF